MTLITTHNKMTTDFQKITRLKCQWQPFREAKTTHKSSDAKVAARGPHAKVALGPNSFDTTAPKLFIISN